MPPPTNTSAPPPLPEPHPLKVAGAGAIRSLVSFYETAITDEQQASMEWRLLLEESQRKAQQWFDQLSTISQLPVEKQPEETMADAVLRYVGELSESFQFETGKAAGELSAARLGFRNLCDKHNITVPCGAFVEKDNGTTGPLRPCATCHQPRLFHEPSAMSTPAPAPETAS